MAGNFRIFSPRAQKSARAGKPSSALWGLPLIFALLCSACGTERVGPPHLLLITLDTTRADHLGAYGYRRGTSPHFDALAAESDLYMEALSTSSWTLPAHASLFTGQFPATHGAQYAADGPLVLGDAIEAPAGIRARTLPPTTPTLANLLGEAGYATAGFVAGPWLLRTFGLASGFNHWDDAGILDHGGRRAGDVTDAAIEWLRSRPDQPFFLFVNYFDPHFPYEPAAEHATAFLPEGTNPNPALREQWEALYDAEIQEMDASLGMLLDYLRKANLYDDTMIVVTADHGELFGEHDEWGHGRILYRELVRIPLLRKPASVAPIARVLHERTQLVDVFRWLLEAAGLDAPDATAEVNHPILAEVRSLSGKDAAHTRVAWFDRFKLHVPSPGEPLLFDTERDPRERVNRFGDDPARSKALLARLEDAFAALPKRSSDAPAPELDPATLKALSELGYVE